MFVVMRKDSGSIGGFTHLRDFTVKSEAEKFVNGADGMVLVLWSRKQYEDWYRSNIESNYV